MVVVTYNEEDSGSGWRGRLVAPCTLGEAHVYVQVLDDSSPDGSGDIVRAYPEFGARNKRLTRTAMDGLGAASRAGFTTAAAIVITTRDGVAGQFAADRPHPTDEISAMLARLGGRTTSRDPHAELAGAEACALACPQSLGTRRPRRMHPTRDLKPKRGQRSRSSRSRNAGTSPRVAGFGRRTFRGPSAQGSRFLRARSTRIAFAKGTDGGSPIGFWVTAGLPSACCCGGSANDWAVALQRVGPATRLGAATNEQHRQPRRTAPARTCGCGSRD